MRFYFYLLIITSFIFGNCQKPEVAKGTPSCISDRIAEMQAAKVTNPPASVWQYEYNGQTVYYLPPTCCDQYGSLLDKNCNIICHPDGGITGKGDGRCSDFAANRKNGKLIWQDQRE